MADQLRWDYLSCSCATHIDTPNLDWLASNRCIWIASSIAALDGTAEIGIKLEMCMRHLKKAEPVWKVTDKERDASTWQDNVGAYLQFENGKRLVFTDTYSEGWKPAADPFMTAILEFEDDGNGGTTYTATVRHRSPEARQSHEDMGFYDG